MSAFIPLWPKLNTPGLVATSKYKLHHFFKMLTSLEIKTEVLRMASKLMSFLQVLAPAVSDLLCPLLPLALLLLDSPGLGISCSLLSYIACCLSPCRALLFHRALSRNPSDSSNGTPDPLSLSTCHTRYSLYLLKMLVCEALSSHD